MEHDFYLANAFTTDPFGGNPAATVLLDGPDWPAQAWMQGVAAQFNLAETAFVLPKSGGAWGLRWLTPLDEVDLCGHATLATAHVLGLAGRAPAGAPLAFETRSGRLTCVPGDGGGIAMDFPAIAVSPTQAPALALQALGLRSLVAAAADSIYLLLELADEAAVRAVRPDFGALCGLDPWGIIITARAASDGDFVSRFFAPKKGVPEDPVTGSAHCRLTPYWGARLGKTRLRARQVSARGGVLDLESRGERVVLTGNVVCVGQGRLTL